MLFGAPTVYDTFSNRMVRKTLPLTVNMVRPRLWMDNRQLGNYPVRLDDYRSCMTGRHSSPVPGEALRYLAEGHAQWKIVINVEHDCGT